MQITTKDINNNDILYIAYKDSFPDAVEMITVKSVTDSDITFSIHKNLICVKKTDDRFVYFTTYSEAQAYIENKFLQMSESYKTDFIKDSKGTDQVKYSLVEKVDELFGAAEYTANFEKEVEEFLDEKME